MKKDRLYELNGEKKLLSRWCEIYNADFQIVFNRIKARGSSALLDHLTNPVGKEKPKKYYHNGSFKSIPQIAADENITPVKLRKDIKKYGFNQAILRLSMYEMVWYNDKMKSLKEWSRILNIQYTTLRVRLENGYHVNQAFEYNQAKDIVDSKDIKRYGSSNYLIYSDGRVYNYKTMKFLNPSSDYTGGNPMVTLYIDGVNRPFLLKILIAKMFVGNPDNESCVGFKNGNRLDCRASNLYWASKGEIKRREVILNPIYLVSKSKGSVIRKFYSYDTAAQYLSISEKVVKRYIATRKIIKQKFIMVRKNKYKYTFANEAKFNFY